MKLEKGDLIAIKTIEDKRVTAVVSHIFNDQNYAYCYLIEFDRHQLVYTSEVEFLIAKDYDLDISWDEELFNLDYYLYEMYTSSFFRNYDFDSEDDD